MRVSQPYGERYKEQEFSQEPKIRYFIACEGEKTEYRYFQGIIDFRTEIGINPLIEIIPIKHEKNTSSNPLNIYNDAKVAIKTAPNYLSGDKLCIIADRDKDSFTEEQYAALLNAEKKDEIKFCISNPCFEFWLLLHYSDCSEFDSALLFDNKKEGNRTYVEKCLMSKLGGSYSKINLRFESTYKDRIKIAIDNSLKYQTSADLLQTEIGTNIGLLIQEMILN